MKTLTMETVLKSVKEYFLMTVGMKMCIRDRPQTCRQTGEPHVQAAFAVEIFHVLGLLG